MSSITDTPIRKLPSYAILFCALLTFAITLGVIGGYIYFPEQASATFGEISGSHPLYFLATWAPGIAGILLVLAYGGLLRCAGPLFAPSVLALRSGLVGLHPERHPGRLHGGVAHQGRAAPCTSAAGGRGRHGRPHVHHAVSGADGGVRLAGGQPLLQRHVAPFWAGAIIGTVWGIWHLPAFFLAGVDFAEWDFLSFFVGNITLAILVTPIFNSARGSLLLPMLFHWQLINPFWPDAQPWDTCFSWGLRRWWSG